LEGEMDMVDAGSTGVIAIRAGGCQGRVNANKTPVGTSSAGWETRDAEELAGAGTKSRGKEGSRPRSRCRGKKLTVSQVNCNFPTDAFFDRRRKIHATVRDSNGFLIANLIIASFATHFGVLNPGTFILLIICF
jgi:hypothetical protein